MESVMDALSEHWDKLNVSIHSIAFAPKDDLDGRVTDVSLVGFLTVMEVSVWSLLRLMHLAETILAKEGGSVFTMSYFGGEEVVPRYGIMGPVTYHAHVPQNQNAAFTFRVAQCAHVQHFK